jgi:hypothetical protein
MFLGYNFYIMLKSLAILAVFIALGIDNPGKKNDGSDLANKNGENKPSPTISVTNNQACPPDTDTANAKPPHWYTSPEWWLCILGLPTLIFIGWQAKAASNAAQATLKQADHIVSSERAWMIASMDNPIIPTDGPYLYAGIPKLTNKGKTPAFVFEIANAVVVLPSGDTLPPQPSGFESNNVFKYDGRGLAIAPEGIAGRPIISSQSEDADPILKEKRIVWVYGYVRYWDVFLEKQRETRYCFRCIPSLMPGVIDHNFVFDGPSAYNEAT